MTLPWVPYNTNMIPQKQKDASKFIDELEKEYNKHNVEPISALEADYYLDQLTAADYWISLDGSIIVINDDCLLYSSWQGKPRDDFLFLLEVFPQYPELHVIPLGTYLHDLVFLMNGNSLERWNQGGSSKITLNIAKYDVDDIKRYLQWVA